MFKKQIVDKLNEIASSRHEFDEDVQRGELNKITAPLVALENHLREQIQADTSSQIETIIQKLKTNSEIDDTDFSLIRLWMVGDAQGYIEMENDYKGWLSELNRLLSVIQGMRAEELTLENMYRLSGTVRDAIRVTGDIVFFKQQQDRVEKFENASKNLNSKNKRILADILQKKLDSNEM